MISCVMPAYNAQRYLGESIGSILSQSFEDFELIVVDDGSTDQTLSIAREFAARDRRVRVIAADHTDLAGALNRGIAEARHPWIARMDADDIAHPDRFKRQLQAAAAQPQVLVWGTFARHINSRGRVLGVSRTGPTTIEEYQRLLEAGEDIYVIHPTWLARRDAILRAGGYDPAFNACEDLDLIDRIARLGPILAIPEPLLDYRVHASSSSARRYFLMRHRASFVVERRRALRRGKEMSWLDFDAHCRGRPVLVKARDAMLVASGFYYRQAGVHFGEHRLARACACFTAATALHPVYAVRRIWLQMLSRTARKLQSATPFEMANLVNTGNPPPSPSPSAQAA